MVLRAGFVVGESVGGDFLFWGLGNFLYIRGAYRTL